MGLPTAHHIVVYMLAQLPDDSKKIKLQLQESEVSAAAWLDEFTVAEIVKSDEYGKTRNVGQRYFRFVIGSQCCFSLQKLSCENRRYKFGRKGDKNYLANSGNCLLSF